LFAARALKRGQPKTKGERRMKWWREAKFGMFSPCGGNSIVREGAGRTPESTLPYGRVSAIIGYSID